MSIMKSFRSLFVAILTCVIIWSSFGSPVFAADDPTGSFINGFWTAVGAAFGSATGTVAVCYTVDALIAPVAPPAAAYLATMCPAIGATVGGFGGAAAVQAVVKAH